MTIDINTLAGQEVIKTAIKTTYESNADTNAFTDAYKLTVDEIIPTGIAWASGSTYPAGAVLTDNLEMYVSQQDNNTGNQPSTDDGTWWLLAVSESSSGDWELNTTKTVAFDIPTATDITETWVDITTTDTVATQVTEFGTNIDGEETITQTLVKDGVTTETVTTFETDGSITVVKQEVV
jgi:hypothetical protein